MIVAGMYALCLWISGRYYYAFRVSGGLRGSVDNSKQARKYRAQRRETEADAKGEKADQLTEQLLADKEKAMTEQP